MRYRAAALLLLFSCSRRYCWRHIATITGGMGIPPAFVYRILPHKLLPYTYTPRKLVRIRHRKPNRIPYTSRKKLNPNFGIRLLKHPIWPQRHPHVSEHGIHLFYTKEHVKRHAYVHWHPTPNLPAYTTLQKFCFRFSDGDIVTTAA